MKLSITDSSYLGVYPKETALQKMAEHGYSGVDFQGFVNVKTDFFRSGMPDFLDSCRKIRAEYESAGLTVCQAHAPWTYPRDESTPEKRAALFADMQKAVAGTSALGCGIFVIHPIMPYGADSADHPEEVRAINVDFLGKLADYAKPLGVTVCLENMPFTKHPVAKPSAILDVVKTADRENLRVCLDTGHAALFRDELPDAAVRLLGKDYLFALHIHDNNGYSDLHYQPFHGVIQWEAFRAALAEIGYDRWYSLETSAKSVPMPMRDRAEMLLSDMLRYIASKPL